MTIGPLTARRALVLLFRLNRTAIPASTSIPKTAASTGLPSRVEASVPADPPPIPNHADTGLDPTIQSQMTGSHKALEFRTDLSRSRKKSPAIPAQQIRKAIQNIIRASSAAALIPTRSESPRGGGNERSTPQGSSSFMPVAVSVLQAKTALYNLSMLAAFARARSTTSTLATVSANAATKDRLNAVNPMLKCRRLAARI